MSSILWILKGNLHLVITIIVVFNEDVKISIIKALNRNDVNRFATNCDRSDTIVKNQSLGRSSLYQFFHIGCTTEVNANNIGSGSYVNGT